MTEQWVKIEAFPDYSISSEGRVRRDTGGRGARPGRVVKNSRDSNGYAVVNISNNGPQAKQYVHHLVARAFLPTPPSHASQIAHWDGDGMNAASVNLRWTDQSENEADKRRHGRANYVPKGSRTFDSAQVDEILSLHAAGHSLRAIGRRFGVTHDTIKTAIRHGTVPI